MTVEDTEHYSLNATDNEEWWTVFPKGGGYVRLGRDQRPFSVSMYRQVSPYPYDCDKIFDPENACHRSGAS